MTNRTTSLDRFISSTTWGDWTRAALAADASSRSYIRLSKNTESVIVMDAPPETGEDVRPFVNIADALIRMTLAAPAILQQDHENGFLILEDLGQTDFPTHLRQCPGDIETLYRCASDVLVHIHQQKPLALPQMTPKVAGDMVKITTEHYVDVPEASPILADAVTRAMQANCGPAQHLALRDFHAENLIWRPHETGLAQVGLLDFQDAFIAPAGYDLASLLRDARHDVPDDIAKMVTRQFAAKVGADIDRLDCALATLAVQRNLRILGVFARLIRSAGKPRYRAMLPRVWAHLQSDLQHPALSELKDVVEQTIPSPKDAGFSE